MNEFVKFPPDLREKYPLEPPYTWDDEDFFSYSAIHYKTVDNRLFVLFEWEKTDV